MQGGRAELGKSRESLRDMECFNASTNSWQRMAPMAFPRASLGATALDGRIFAVGGQSHKVTHASVEVYDSSIDRWTTLSSLSNMSQPRKYLAVAAAPGPGLIFAVGGMTGTRARLAAVEALDPREGKWHALPAMHVARSSCGACVLDGELFVVGGNVAAVNVAVEGGGEAHQGVESYSLAAGRWRTVAQLASRRSGLSVTAV